MGRVSYNQSGYTGQSRSDRATGAESRGLYPKSRAIPEVARMAGVTRKRAAEALANVGPAEWHHIGKYAAKCDYYSFDAAVGWLWWQGVKDKLPEDWEKRIDTVLASDSINTRIKMRDDVCRRLESISGIPSASIVSAYYSLWDKLPPAAEGDEKGD